MATITATTEIQNQTQFTASSNSSPSATDQPWTDRRGLYSKFTPRFADWFEDNRDLTNTHKRIAYNFADIFQKHSPALQRSKQTKKVVEPDDPSASYNVEDLFTEANVASYNIGTGEDITNLQCSEILAAENEVIFVTGFLHPSSASVKILHRTIEILATRQTLKNVRRGTDDVLKVYVCFSSSGFTQKIFHTKSRKGRIWQPKEWMKLGIADPKYLAGRVDLTVKSLFFRPVGLLHGKYMIVDRKTLVVPSANVSWEEWLEGATIYTKASGTYPCMVEQFVRFWESVWQFGEPRGPATFEQRRYIGRLNVADHEGGAGIIHDKPKGSRIVGTPWSGISHAVFLPHPYQQSFPPVFPLMDLPEFIWKIFRRLMGIAFTLAPADEVSYLGNPQNAFIIAAIEGAQESIYMHTPNVTAKPIIDALLRAVKRGVVVEIVTSMIMMKTEQLVTAGTTTEKCLAKMVNELAKYKAQPPAGAISTGALFVYQFNPTKRPQLPPFVKSPEDNHRLKWFDKTHVKCLIVDEEVVMLGSGNADRASWVTSQEINLGLFLTKEKTRVLRQGLVDALAGRLEVVKGSSWVRGGGDPEDELDYGVDGMPRKRFLDLEA